MRQAGDPVPTAVGIGHVHLRVADPDRALTFYRDVLGLTLNAYGPDLGVPDAAFLAAGGYHHHVGLNTFESKGARPRRPGTRASTISPSSNSQTRAHVRAGSWFLASSDRSVRRHRTKIVPPGTSPKRRIFAVACGC
jgi:catechol-2,3-dioxygenase